jgi:hypothetical protein
MEEVIGLRGTPGHGSLQEWGVSYRELALAADGRIDWQALQTAIVPGGLPGSCWAAVCTPEEQTPDPYECVNGCLARCVWLGPWGTNMC